MAIQQGLSNLEITRMSETDYINKILEKSLTFFSDKEIEKIRNTTIAQAGFGGVGALATELLARWGIKKFRLLDMDKYEISNMNRQIFATTETLGQYKTEVSAERIKKINPYAIVEKIYCEKLSKDNVLDFVRGADIIINAIDSASGHVLLHYNAKKFKIPLIHFHCMDVTGVAIEVFDYRLFCKFGLYTPFLCFNGLGYCDKRNYQEAKY